MLKILVFFPLLPLWCSFSQTLPFFLDQTGACILFCFALGWGLFLGMEKFAVFVVFIREFQILLYCMHTHWYLVLLDEGRFVVLGVRDLKPYIVLFPKEW